MRPLLLMINRDAMPPLPARMLRVVVLAALCALGHAASAQQSPSPVIHHDLQVTLDPANHHIKVRDRIRVPGALVTAPVTLSLAADLTVQSVSGGPKLVTLRSRGPGSASGVV